MGLMKLETSEEKDARLAKNRDAYRKKRQGKAFLVLKFIKIKIQYVHFALQ
jgi:hypothetical protein